jgi:hypothetical protein
MAGYSGTPLPKKLGITSATAIVALGAPPGYRQILGELPAGAKITTKLRPSNAFIHLFVRRREALSTELVRCRAQLVDEGMIWVSWPKRSSGIETDVIEDTIRALALPLGLVDTKVCAVDNVWSGLKLMVRRENRARESRK